MDSYWVSPYYPMRSFFDLRPLHLLGALEDSTREMDREFSNLERRLNSALRQELQGVQGGNSSHNTSLSLGVQPEIVTEGDAKKYRLNIHMGNNFAPEDVKVSLKDGVVTIDAKKEKTSEDGNSRFYQEVTRKFTLPANLEMKEVKSSLSPDGVLKIEAPLPKKALPEPPKATEIPVKLE